LIPAAGGWEEEEVEEEVEEVVEEVDGTLADVIVSLRDT